MGGLSFLSPLYLLGALAVAVPIVLHLFRRRTETVVDFPAVRLLSASPIEQQRRRRLRELVLLALRVTALLLLAGAFARPYLASATLAADAPVTVVAVDTSFSLSAPATFARARELAVAAVREAPTNHAVALMTFGDTAVTVATPTTDRGAVIAAIAGLAPGASGTRYGAAVARAAELLGGRVGRVVVVTDLQQAGWEGSPRAGLPEDVEVVLRAVESPLQNVAITTAERRGTRIDAAIHNFGFETRTVPAALAVDGQVVARASVTAPAQSAAHVEFDADVPATGGATVTVDDPGGFAADDSRHLVLDPAASTRLTVVVADPTGLRGGLYVQRALEAAGAGRAFAATVVDGRALSGWTAEQLAREHALIVLGTRTLERSGRDLVSRYLAQGGSVLLSLGPDVDPGTLTDVIGDASGLSPDPQDFGSAGATLVLGDTRHPIFRLFAEPAAALGDVSFLRYRPVDESGRSVLARYSGGAPALLEVPRERGRLLLFTSDLDNQWNRFPLSPAFVPFMIESARYLTEGRGETQSWVLPATPPGLGPVPGVFTVADAAGADRRVAVNVDIRESNPSPISTDEFLAAVPRVARTTAADPLADARQAEDEQRLWQLGLLVMFVALASEGLVGRRAN
jgi:hypothetical protein